MGAEKIDPHSLSRQIEMFFLKSESVTFRQCLKTEPKQFN